jgi:5'-nucleotidase
VNLPQTERGTPRPETVFCQLDPHALPVRYDTRDGQLHYAGSYHQRSRLAEHDVDVCFSGRIAITLIRLREAAASELLM